MNKSSAAAPPPTWLVTGGAGFIGANFVLRLRERSIARVINLDNLTYAGNLSSLEPLAEDPDHVFVHGDIGDSNTVGELLAEHRPAAVIHLAAESHVDRSIVGPAAFLKTNVVGSFHLLQAVCAYWQALPDSEGKSFRYLHVSTDEVYGSLEADDPPFNESTAFAPNSPYAASKASADHFARAFHRTYGLPLLITHCTNNYGPLQFPEKLIPLMIQNALAGEPLPIYGDGQQVRDWIYVTDHCDALVQVMERGTPGETYAIASGSELPNLLIAERLCGILDRLRPDSAYRPHEQLIAFVKDRPGHDRRYSMDARKIRGQLGWAPAETLESGLERTVRWYLEHQAWVDSVRSGEYRRWIEAQYGRGERGAS